MTNTTTPPGASGQPLSRDALVQIIEKMGWHRVRLVDYGSGVSVMEGACSCCEEQSEAGGLFTAEEYAFLLTLDAEEF